MNVMDEENRHSHPYGVWCLGQEMAMYGTFKAAAIGALDALLRVKERESVAITFNDPYRLGLPVGLLTLTIDKTPELDDPRHR